MKSLKQICLDAANIVLRGWCKMYYARKANGDHVSIEHANRVEDKFCVVGAIIVAAGWKDHYDPSFEDTLNSIRNLLPEIPTRSHTARQLTAMVYGRTDCREPTAYQCNQDLYCWNDADGRTAMEVAGILRLAAARASRKGL